MTVTLNILEAAAVIVLIDYFFATPHPAVKDGPQQIAFLQNMKDNIHNQLAEDRTLAQ